MPLLSIKTTRHAAPRSTAQNTPGWTRSPHTHTRHPQNLPPNVPQRHSRPSALSTASCACSSPCSPLCLCSTAAAQLSSSPPSSSTPARPFCGQVFFGGGVAGAECGQHGAKVEEGGGTFSESNGMPHISWHTGCPMMNHRSADWKKQTGEPQATSAGGEMSMCMSFCCVVLWWPTRGIGYHPTTQHKDPLS